MKAIFLNGSPRKNFNTAKLLESAMSGAKDAGAEVELINLYDFEYTGCKSCFACKIKNSKTNGLCIVKDKLRPILEKTFDADAIIVGSPVYLSYPTGQVINFMERLTFPINTYNVDENGNHMTLPHKPVKTAIIYTMNCPEDWMEKFNYKILLGEFGKIFENIFGHNEIFYCCNTYQYADYSRYEGNMFDEKKKREHRDKQFPKDLQKAYELGKSFAE